MQKSDKHNLKYQLKSFRWAFNGLTEFFKSEAKAKIHTMAAIAIIAVGVTLNISNTEWLFISFTIASVFICEIINTALERMADCLGDEHDIKRGQIKDLGAAAVLVSALMAIVVACFVFIPKF